jgi:hypothetical protein
MAFSTNVAPKAIRGTSQLRRAGTGIVGTLRRGVFHVGNGLFGFHKPSGPIRKKAS